MPPDAHPVDEPDASAPSLEDVLTESARLHATRASVLRLRLESERRRPRSLTRRALDSRPGHRGRLGVLGRRGRARSLALVGGRATLARIRRQIAPGADAPTVPAGRDGGSVYERPTATPAGCRLRHRVLIVAELSIPQCSKYRVWQRKEFFDRLGVPCTVVSWTRVAESLSLLQTHTLAILYRVPGTAGPLSVVAEARRLGIETIWEVDDLIFDVELYGANANLRDLTGELRRNLLDGAAAYRQGLLACDRSIGSTGLLAELMARATGKPSHVVANALDAETLGFAADAIAARRRSDDHVVIAYGSGTLTHDADFAVAAPALLRLLAEAPRVRLLIMGSLNLAHGFAAYADRIERVGSLNFKAYLARLACADIAVAPLEATTFNDAKSNIKLIEASIVDLPSVCSPCREFRAWVEHGVDGFLAETEAEWFDALRALVADRALRTRVAARSRERVLAGFSPARVSQTAVAPLARLIPAGRREAVRVLIVNVFFAPRSFGGATVIAEEMAERLAGLPGIETFVFTSHGFDAPQYTLRRYRARRSDVIGIAVPDTGDDILGFDDPEVARQFDDVLEAVEPDVVHFHSIQGFGAGIVRACQRRAIPYLITVHDAWWLCQRQFMVRGDNTYCHQTTIDLKVCEHCLPAAHHLQSRMDMLRHALLGAVRVLSPSASHASLYRANGVPAHRLVVNRNGIRMPARPRPARRPGPLRFGFVGGNEALKGVALIRKAFAALTRSDWVLVLVDNTLNLGFASFKRAEWRLRGRVQIVPAYGQDELDDFFEGIDVLLFPSQWKESFGMTVREALARDVWVLATESGGAAEQIVPGVNGTLIPMGNDPAPLREAVVCLLDRAAMFDAGYVNPHKAELATLDDQARALHALLVDASGRCGTGVAAEQQQQ